MAAHNPALTQLLAALNAAPHAGMGNDFFAHVGSSLALARSVPPEWFPRSGTATAAQIGGLIARLHTLTTVAWAAYPLNGANDMSQDLAQPLSGGCANSLGLESSRTV